MNSGELGLFWLSWAQVQWTYFFKFGGIYNDEKQQQERWSVLVPVTTLRICMKNQAALIPQVHNAKLCEYSQSVWMWAFEKASSSESHCGYSHSLWKAHKIPLSRGRHPQNMLKYYWQSKTYFNVPTHANVVQHTPVFQSIPTCVSMYQCTRPYAKVFQCRARAKPALRL